MSLAKLPSLNEGFVSEPSPNLLSSEPHAMMMAAREPHARTETNRFREDRTIDSPTS